MRAQTAELEIIPARTFQEGFPLHGWQPLYAKDLRDPVIRQRVALLARIYGPAPFEDRGLKMTTGVLPDGRLAVVSNELIPHGKYVLEVPE